jgi:ferredoxin
MGGLPKGVYDIVSIMDCIARGGEVKGVFGQGLVVGSDEMAIDAAMAMKRYCREVTILSPYSVGVMRILDAGVDIAIANGVNVISGIELCGINEMSGRLSAVDIRIKEKDYVMNIPCDTLVIGDCQVPDTDTIASRNKNLELDGRGYIKVDARMETTMAGIFALGDLEMSAADAGRAGAIAIDNHLAHVDQAVPMKFKGVKDYPSTYEIIEGRKDEDNPFAQRTGETQIYTKQQAEYEASRCIGCGYRQIDIDRCIGCGICEKQCLGDAIEMVRIPDSQGSEKEAE